MKATKRIEVSEGMDISALLEDLDDYISEEDDEYDPKKQDFDEIAAIKSHSHDWAETLTRDDTMSSTLLLHDLLVHQLQFPLTKAVELISEVVGLSDRTVREWRSQFVANQGSFPDSEQGRYQPSGVLWHNDELNKAALQFVQKKNTCVKGTKNLTSVSLCKWINEVLLMNSVLEPGYPRKVSLSTALRWLHNLGFEVVKKKKGTYVNGHEREDVVEYRTRFL